jgi:hypothetical protein
MDLNIEEIDLASLGDALQRAFDTYAPTGFVRGRTMLRDAVVEHLGCSEPEAERLVDTMVSLGFLKFDGDPTSAADSAVWIIRSSL